MIIKNLWRRKSRTILTVLGISLGIATIVTLGIITGGLSNTMEKIIKTGEADFTVAQGDVADFSFSSITRDQLKEIRATPGVKSAIGVLLGFVQTPKNPMFTLFGIDRRDIGAIEADLTRGRFFDDGKDELVIGKIAAKNLDLKIGDTLPVRGKNFQIVGIFQTGNPMQDGGGLVPLANLQKMDKKENQVTMVLVKVTDKVTDIESFTDKFEKKFDGDLTTLASVEDFSSVDSGMEIMDFTSTAISVLAVVIGGIGVMNTVMMSVFERTREIGILRAVGWKKRRVLTMILGEAFLLGVLSIGVGIAIGLGVIHFIMTYPVAQSFLVPDYSFKIFERAVLVGVLVSIGGGLYPAWRATRFSPAEALRYE